ncbi:MAG: hypothetical protein M3N41_08815, partial [Acidobacteriota bacterium]|nr:hypothetical protein [Acidobacteriota bacterium]
MGKKLYSKPKWKRYIRHRQLAQLRAARRVEQARRIRPVVPVSGRRKRKKDIRPRRTIVAPPVLSLIDNPEDTIAFLDEIESSARSNHLSLDLSHVSTLTTDGIAVLLATIRKDNIHNTTNIQGNFPDDPSAQERLVQSGFLSFISTARQIPRAPKGRMAERKSKKVEPKTARDLIHTGTKAIYGTERRSTAAYRVLIESMGNTHNHAAGQKPFRETWWATVYADVDRGRLCYTFVDT